MSTRNFAYFLAHSEARFEISAKFRVDIALNAQKNIFLGLVFPNYCGAALICIYKVSENDRAILTASKLSKKIKSVS